MPDLVCYLFEICSELVRFFQRSMRFLVWFGIEIPSNAFGLDIVKKVNAQVIFRKIPTLWFTFRLGNIFLWRIHQPFDSDSASMSVKHNLRPWVLKTRQERLDRQQGSVWYEPRELRTCLHLNGLEYIEGADIQTRVFRDRVRHGQQTESTTCKVTSIRIEISRVSESITFNMSSCFVPSAKLTPMTSLKWLRFLHLGTAANLRNAYNRCLWWNKKKQTLHQF